MPNRVIKESIWNSPTLSALPLDAQLHWPRWLLMADDWGCFNCDSDVIKGLVYPKIAAITVKKINTLIETYYNSGLLFHWNEGGRMWGFFIRWGNHQFCNRTHVDGVGKQVRHNRKTPEPPEIELNQYLERLLEGLRVGQSEYRNPNPNPNPNLNPIPNHIHGEYKNVVLSEEEYEKLSVKLGDNLLHWIETFSKGIKMKEYGYKNHYLAILKWSAKGENGNGDNRFAGIDKAGEIIQQRIKEAQDESDRLG